MSNNQNTPRLQEQRSTTDESISLTTSENESNLERQKLVTSSSRGATSKITASEDGIVVPPQASNFSVVYQRSDGSRGMIPVSLESTTSKISVKDLFTVTKQRDGSFLVSQNGAFSGKISITILGESATFSSPDTGAGKSSQSPTVPQMPQSINGANLQSQAPSFEPKSITYVSPTRLSAELATTFSRYATTIGADVDLSSNNPLWESHRQQYLQLVHEYESKLVDKKRSLPCDQGSLREIQKINTQLNALFDTYEKCRESIREEGEAAAKNEGENVAPVDALPEMPWGERAHRLFPKIAALYKEIEQERSKPERFPSATTTRVQERNSNFIERSELFADVYSQKQWHSDPKMMNTMVRHWEVLVQQFEKERSATASFFSFDFNLSFVKEMSESKGVSLRYNKEMTPIEVRSQILAESRFAPREKVTSAQLASLLYLDAHFKEVGGERLPDERAPTLNSADHDALVSKLAHDRLKDPEALANEAIATLGFAEGSQEAFGIRYGLGVAELTPKQRSQLEFGARVASKRFQGPIRSAISDKYYEGVQGLERAKDAGVQIRAEVWKRADQGISNAINSFGAVKSKFVDSSPRHVTEGQLYEFQRHSQVLTTFDSSFLKDVGETTGSSITPFIPGGFNQEIVRHFINHVTMATPRVGIPPGVALKVKNGGN